MKFSSMCHKLQIFLARVLKTADCVTKAPQTQKGLEPLQSVTPSLAWTEGHLFRNLPIIRK